MSGRDPLTCGFLKVKVFNLLVRDSYEIRDAKCTAETGEIYKRHCKEVKEFFELSGDAFDFKQDLYRKNLTSVGGVLKELSKSNASFKQNILQTFSKESWERLERDEKEKHQPENCNACLSNRKFKLALSQFPVKGPIFKSKAKKYGLIRAPLGDITNQMNEKNKEELIKKKTVKDIEDIKKSTAVVRYVL